MEFGDLFMNEECLDSPMPTFGCAMDFLPVNFGLADSMPSSEETTDTMNRLSADQDSLKPTSKKPNHSSKRKPRKSYQQAEEELRQKVKGAEREVHRLRAENKRLLDIGEAWTQLHEQTARMGALLACAETSSITTATDADTDTGIITLAATPATSTSDPSPTLEQAQAAVNSVYDAAMNLSQPAQEDLNMWTSLPVATAVKLDLDARNLMYNMMSTIWCTKDDETRQKMERTVQNAQCIRTRIRHVLTAHAPAMMLQFWATTTSPSPPEAQARRQRQDHILANFELTQSQRSAIFLAYNDYRQGMAAQEQALEAARQAAEVASYAMQGNIAAQNMGVSATAQLLHLMNASVAKRMQLYDDLVTAVQEALTWQQAVVLGLGVRPLSVDFTEVCETIISYA